MENEVLKTLFILIKTKLNRNNKAPIKCRITYKKKRLEFNTGYFVTPDLWISSMQIVNPKVKESELLNLQLNLIKQNINQVFYTLKVNKESFDVKDIYRLYKGEDDTKEKTLLEVFDLHNAKMKKLVGIEYSKSTYPKFLEAKKHVSDFIRYEYKQKDYLLSDLKLKFLEEFDTYLKVEKRQKQITINKSIQRLRKIVKLAISEGFLSGDPFLLYKPKKVLLEVVYLTPEELKSMEGYTFKQERLEQVKDMFVFCCYTGLPYQEMASLRSNNIVKGFDKLLWIQIKRKKTNKLLQIPLLPKAKSIIDKYRNGDDLLPVISNQRFNSYLKEIANIIGINKRLTHHVARKTFATTVLLFNDVPMEIVSEILGHSSIKITQNHYGKIVQKKVSEQMRRLNKILK